VLRDKWRDFVSPVWNLFLGRGRRRREIARLKRRAARHGRSTEAELLQRAGIELVSTRGLMESATRLATELDYPACDCLSLAWRLRIVVDLSLPMSASFTRFGGIRKAHFMTVC
jgi:plasmid stability protein